MVSHEYANDLSQIASSNRFAPLGSMKVRMPNMTNLGEQKSTNNRIIVSKVFFSFGGFVTVFDDMVTMEMHNVGHLSPKSSIPTQYRKKLPKFP